MTTTPLARRLSALTVPALLAVSLTACGGGSSGAPEDASKDDFCEAYLATPDLGDSFGDASAQEQAATLTDALETYIDDLKDVGTPEDIPDEARGGFEVSIDAAEDIDEDKLAQAFEDEDDDYLDTMITGDDKKKSDAFDEWARDYCG